jgi:hypothetical protein
MAAAARTKSGWLDHAAVSSAVAYVPQSRYFQRRSTVPHGWKKQESAGVSGNAAAGPFFGSYEPPAVSLLVRESDLAKAEREQRREALVPMMNWPPLGWRSEQIPRDDSDEALRQWFAYYKHPVGPLRCAEVGQAFRSTDWSSVVQDAWRLVRHQNHAGRAAVPVHEHGGRLTPSQALVELETIESGLFPPKAPPPLSLMQRIVFEIIQANPGISGKGVIAEARKCHGRRLSQSTLTKHIIPVLRARCGVANEGKGYFVSTSVK